MKSSSYNSAIRLTIISVLAVLSFSVTGCVTWALNNQIEEERRTKLGSPDGNSRFAYNTYLKNRNIRYYKGSYVGLSDVEGEVYYRYIFYHVFQNPNGIYLELLIPVQYSEKDAIVRATNIGYIIKGPPAYMTVGDTKYSLWDNAINPTFILKEDADPDVPATFSSDYPLLFTLHMGQIGEKVRMRIGRKLSNAELDKTDVQSKNYDIIVVCPDTPLGFGLLSFHTQYEITPSVKKECEIWQWSKLRYSKNLYEPAARTELEVRRYIGYIFTVPLDIITSPIQLPVWIGYYGYVEGFGRAMNYP